MERTIKCKSNHLCIALFTCCLFIRFGDHLFNNTVATNMLHVVSSTDADELQTARIMAAQLVSFTFVLVIYIYRSKKEGE